MTEQLDSFGTILTALAGAPFVVACVIGVIALIWYAARNP